MTEAPSSKGAPQTARLEAAIRQAARQEQFLDIVSRDEAWARWTKAFALKPLGMESVALAQGLGRVLAETVRAPEDAPFFDRSNVDGFALRAADTLAATEAQPKILRLNGEVLACGMAPQIEIRPGTATTIATGGMIPRGADAVVMIEHTAFREGPSGPEVEITRAAAPGQFVTHAGSDIAKGETLLHAGQILGAREIAMLAATGLSEICVWRKPKVAVLSTGDELLPPGGKIAPGRVFDSNGAAIAAFVAENGGEPIACGIFRDDLATLEKAFRDALAKADIVVLSGGTSKGAGDLSQKVLARLENVEIAVHGVALKPGKPLCLAVAGGKPVAVLPGFPTSAMFTFHAFVAPVVRALAGLPSHDDVAVEATMPVRLPSERGRTEFAMVSLSAGEEGLKAFPLGKGSGAVTAFGRADGFVEIAALADGLPAGAPVPVKLISKTARAPDLTVAGSHCVGLDILLERLAEKGMRDVRLMAIGSMGGLSAARRGECDLAPIHLMDEKTGGYNRHLMGDGLTLVEGWRRVQGLVFRRDDPRFIGKPVEEAVVAALADETCLMVNRNQGAGTRIVIETLLKRARPPGYFNQPKSHNAAAAAIAQGRADWGVAIETVARDYGLGFTPIGEEHYDFALVEARSDRPAVALFLETLRDKETRRRLVAAGFTPAP